MNIARQNEKVMFAHRGSDTNYQRDSALTVAYKLLPDAVAVSFAFCHPNDRFERAMGRTVAETGLQNLLDENFDGELPYATLIPYSRLFQYFNRKADFLKDQFQGEYKIFGIVPPNRKGKIFLYRMEDALFEIYQRVLTRLLKEMENA